MPDYTDTARRAIEQQLATLREEIKRLEAAAAALGGKAAPRRRGPGRPRRTTAATARRRGRRRGGGTRAAQAGKLVAANPGITIPELADKMGIKQNYLYRVMPHAGRRRAGAQEGQGLAPGLTVAVVSSRQPDPRTL